MIIYEQFFFLGKHLAEKYNKPVVRIFTAPVTNEKLMKDFITSKGPLSIFKYKWIAKAFTKDIPMKTDNWLDEIMKRKNRRIRDYKYLLFLGNGLCKKI